MSGGDGRDPTKLAAITFDFANTLVPVDRRGFRAVVQRTAADVADACSIHDQEAFLVAWDEERDRQFQEDVPAGREVDLIQRVARVLARLRGQQPPQPDGRWDDAAAYACSSEEERALVVEGYTRSFRPDMNRWRHAVDVAWPDAACGSGSSRTGPSPRQSSGMSRLLAGARC